MLSLCCETSGTDGSVIAITKTQLKKCTSRPYPPLLSLLPAVRCAHWRIRTGIMQPDTANTTEVNLALALQSYGSTSVDFATVWGLAHTVAERTGDGPTNFIAWVKETVAK